LLRRDRRAHTKKVVEVTRPSPEESSEDQRPPLIGIYACTVSSTTTTTQQHNPSTRVGRSLWSQRAKTISLMKYSYELNELKLGDETYTPAPT
jgi:hypothetical protein